MTVERYGSKTDVIVKLVLVFFIALLSFSIGTFVGKKFSDNQYKLAQLEPEKHETAASETEEHGDTRAVASVSEHGDGEAKSNDALSDDEIAKLAEEFISDEDAAPAAHGAADTHGAATTAGHGTAPDASGHAPASVTETHEDTGHAAKPAVHKEPVKAETKTIAPAHATETKKPEVTKAEPLKAATRVAEGKTAGENKAEVKPTSRIPSSLPKEVAASAIGKYTVQVGSYQTEKEAQKISAELKEKGFSAFYVSAQIKGQKWFRVSVGLFATQKEANAYKADLLARSKVSSAIVQKVTSAE